MKKQIGIFFGSIVLAFLSLFIALNSFQLQAQSGGRQAAYSERSAATAVITNVTPLQMAEAIGIPSSLVLSGDFNGTDPRAIGIGNSPLGIYFPNNGNTFAILSTGFASDADSPNDSGSLTGILEGLVNEQGTDMAQLALDLAIPQGVHCIGFDFAFYSEEFPEFVGDFYNDTFTAEIGGTDLSIITDINGYPVVYSPLNFAYGVYGEPISVNTAFGVVSPTMSTYDGVTALLRATTNVDGGSTTQLVFSIQDLGDSSWDSAVFIDNFFMSSEECQSGIGFTPTTGSISPEGGIVSHTNIYGLKTTLDFPAGAVVEDTLIVFTPLVTPTHPLILDRPFGEDIKFAGTAFDVIGISLPEKIYLPFIAQSASPQIQTHTANRPFTAPALSAQGEETFPLGMPVTFVIEYSDERLAEFGILDETSLDLWLFNEAGYWSPAAYTCKDFFFEIDPVANTLTAHVCHFTQFGMVGN